MGMFGQETQRLISGYIALRWSAASWESLFYRHVVPLEQSAFLTGRGYPHARGVICL